MIYPVTTCIYFASAASICKYTMLMNHDSHTVSDASSIRPDVFSLYLRDFITRHARAISIVALKCMMCQLMVVLCIGVHWSFLPIVSYCKFGGSYLLKSLCVAHSRLLMQNNPTLHAWAPFRWERHASSDAESHVCGPSEWRSDCVNSSPSGEHCRFHSVETRW